MPHSGDAPRIREISYTTQVIPELHAADLHAADDSGPLLLVDEPPPLSFLIPQLPLCPVCRGSSVSDEHHPAYCPACRGSRTVEPATAQIITDAVPCPFCYAERWNYTSLAAATAACRYCNATEDAKPGLLPMAFVRHLALLEEASRQSQDYDPAALIGADITQAPTVIVRGFPPLALPLSDPLSLRAALAVAQQAAIHGQVKHARVVCQDADPCYRLWLTCIPEHPLPYCPWHQHKSYVGIDGRIRLRPGSKGISAAHLDSMLGPRLRLAPWHAQLRDA